MLKPTMANHPIGGMAARDMRIFLGKNATFEPRPGRQVSGRAPQSHAVFIFRLRGESGAARGKIALGGHPLIKRFYSDVC
jgi:hypothetical protein